MKRYLYSTLVIVLVGLNLFGQSAASPQGGTLSLTEYLSKVAKGNLGYIAEQFNVSIADAELKAAKVFSDPEVSLSYSNNEDQTLLMGQGIDAAISYPFSLGNKRGAAISLAHSQKEQAQSAVDAYFQNLRAEAALSYFSAIKQKQLLQLQLDIYSQLKKLADADSLRLQVGAIHATDALQTALEARAQQNQVIQAEADYRMALSKMAQLQGGNYSDGAISLTDDFPSSVKEYELSDLIKTALEHRSDLQLAIRNKEISEKQVRLLQAKRAFEFSLEAGYSHSAVVKNEIAPAPAFNTYKAGISIPLKFSNLNRGEVLAARNAVSQSEAQYRDTQVSIAGEVTQAYLALKALEKQFGQYKKGLVEDAEKIVQARNYAYQRGETGLTDLLNAQRTFVDLRIEYLGIRYACTEARINLEKAAGIWDIE